MKERERKRNKRIMKTRQTAGRKERLKTNDDQKKEDNGQRDKLETK